MDMDKAKESLEKTAQDAKGVMEQAMASIKGAFEKFSRDDDKQSDGKTISLKSIERWMQEANLTGDKSSIKSEDLANSYSKISNNQERIDMNQFGQMLDQLAQDKNMEKQSLFDKLSSAAPSDSKSFTERVKGAFGFGKEAKSESQNPSPGAQQENQGPKEFGPRNQ